MTEILLMLDRAYAQLLSAERELAAPGTARVYLAAAASSIANARVALAQAQPQKPLRKLAIVNIHGLRPSDTDDNEPNGAA